MDLGLIDVCPCKAFGSAVDRCAGPESIRFTCPWMKRADSSAAGPIPRGGRSVDTARVSYMSTAGSSVGRRTIFTHTAPRLNIPPTAADDPEDSVT